MSYSAGDIINFAFTGAAQQVQLPPGRYKLEAWGAQGGSYGSYAGGKGGYSVGILTIPKNAEDTLKTLHVYVGGQPATVTTDRAVVPGGFNGGGAGQNRYYSDTYTYGQGGGGATDIRIGEDSLYARVIVAGAGGGSASVDAAITKHGGGTSGGSPQTGYGASQTAAGTNGAFGQGGSATTSGTNYKYGSGGGGGGWYGGGACSSYSDSANYRGYNGGGSGFVWTGENAPSGYLLGEEYYLTDAQTIAGNTSFTAPDGTEETGHSGNGYARITVLETFLNAPENFRISASAYNTVMLSWDAVDGATGYKLYRDGNQIATVTDQSYIDSVNPFICYDYSIIAFNDDGESDRATLSFTFMPDNPIPYLITDRTALDVEYAAELVRKLNAGTATVEELAEWNSIALKGCYDYTDLNRVSAVVQYLDGMLKGHGYIAGVSGKQPGRLPAGYTELEYIESSRTQFIDTGFKPNQDTRVLLDADYTKIGTWICLFGAEDDSNITNGFELWETTSQAISFYYGSATNMVQTIPTSGRHVFDCDKNVYKVDNSITLTNGAATFSCANSLYLFAILRSGSVEFKSAYKLYSCQIYDNGTLVRDFVPCINASGEAGLYDLVGEKFYGNSGTGEFAVGPETDTSGSSPNVWTELNDFTPAYAENYLTNIDRLRSVLALYDTTPKVPDDAETMTVEEANAIEQILVDLESTIKTMLKTRVACGDAYCGGKYL